MVDVLNWIVAHPWWTLTLWALTFFTITAWIGAARR